MTPSNSLPRSVFQFAIANCQLLIVNVFFLAVSSSTFGEPPRKVSELRDFIQHLSWSPDGKKFLFTRIHQRRMGLWTMNADGSGATPLFPKEINPTFDAAWHPSGQRILYVFDRLQ